MANDGGDAATTSDGAPALRLPTAIEGVHVVACAVHHRDAAAAPCVDGDELEIGA